MKSANSRHRIAAWLLLMLLSLGALAWRLTEGIAVQTDIRALLPAAELAPDIQTALDGIQEQALGQHLVLLGHSNKQQLDRALNPFRQSLETGQGFHIQNWDEQAAHQNSVYLQHPYRVMAQGDEKLDAPALVQRALTRLYGLSGLASQTRFEQDPFGTLSAWLDQRPAYSPFSLQGDCLSHQTADTHWCLIQLRADEPGMGLAQTATRVRALDYALGAAQAHVAQLQTYDAGVSRHADFAATTAKHEFSLISIGTMSGIVLLLGLLLRSLSALLVAMLVLGCGGLVGLSACLLLYPQPHLIALVFGACLLGVAVDYAFHFLCAAGSGTHRCNSIAAGLRLGWLTTSIGFAFLLLAPFDSLRQVAVFGVAGLSGAYFTVRCLLPQLPNWALSQPPQGLLDKISRYWPAATAPKPGILIIALCIALACLGLASTLQSRENVRALHAGSTNLLQQETQARRLIDSIDAAQLFIVQAANDADLLLSSRALDSALAVAVAQQRLRRFMSITQALPNYTAQTQAQQHWQETIFAPGAALDQLSARLNLPPHWIDAQRQQFSSNPMLTLDSWQASPASWPQRELLVKTHDGGLAAFTRLGGISDIHSLRTMATQLQRQGHQVQLFDPLEAASQGLNTARKAAVKVLGLALLGIVIILTLRYGIGKGLVSALPLALAISISLAGLALRQQDFSLFCVFALLLVVGMAIDYGLFVREGPSNDVHSLLAVSLSAMTTLLAFGLLGLSSTPALKDFGLIVTLGIASAWISTMLLHRGGWMHKA